jgi:hypothetical protein
MKHRRLLKGLGFAAMMVATAFVVGGVVMMLWNALVPDIFKGPSVTYWQALGLLILSHILFCRPGHGRGPWHRDRWLRRFEHRYTSMPQEEREKLRETLRERWGHTHDDPDHEK